MTEREDQLKAVIRQMLTPLKNIPLDVIVESICGHAILKYDGHSKDTLDEVTLMAGREINQEGIRSRRPNEVGNYCEPFVAKALTNLGHKAGTPTTESGKRKSTGYPDLEATIHGKPYYIEVKTYNSRNLGTTQRSFYLSPSSDFKVTRDAFHLIFAFCMVQIAPGHFKTSSCTVLDAQQLLCDVKYEFNSDNKRMYGADAELLICRHHFDF